MEILTSSLTNTARHISERAVFNIDFTTTDGKLERIQFNIFTPVQQGESPEYVGSIHYDGRNVSCNINRVEDTPHYFEVAAGFIADIIEASSSDDELPVPESAETNDKSR